MEHQLLLQMAKEGIKRLREVASSSEYTTHWWPEEPPVIMFRKNARTQRIQDFQGQKGCSGGLGTTITTKCSDGSARKERPGLMEEPP